MPVVNGFGFAQCYVKHVLLYPESLRNDISFVICIVNLLIHKNLKLPLLGVVYYHHHKVSMGTQGCF